MTGSITAHKDGAIGWLVIDQPAKRNAVNFAMWKAIPEVLGEFDPRGTRVPRSSGD